MIEGALAENRFRYADWRTYTPTDGLPSLLTDGIEQDIDGFLWFTTVHGEVYRFDGEEFRTFTHRDGLPGDQATLRGRPGCRRRTLVCRTGPHHALRWRMFSAVSGRL